MTERERLADLLDDLGAMVNVPVNVDDDGCGTYEIRDGDYIADYLLENGVILPPCKVGDIFYGLTETESDYFEYVVYGFKWGKRRGEDENILIILTTYEMEFILGEEAFLTREEAEKALKERTEE